MRGVILAGGFGTRMKNFTDVSNKHLAPVYSSIGAMPMIFYPIDTLLKSGITKILIISSQEHSGKIIEYLGDGKNLGVDFTYKIQNMKDTPSGIAAALKIAKDFTNNEPFAVILGDNFYEDSFSTVVKTFVKDKNPACIFLKEVEDIHRFGCATVNQNNEVTKIVEKPKNPESNLAVTGFYLYTNEVFKIADKLSPSKRGELEISDINNYFAEKGLLRSKTITGFWSDMGTPPSMIRTQNFINKQDF